MPEETTPCTVYWDHPAEQSATTWISAVEVTSTTATDIVMPLRPVSDGLHSTTSHTFHPDAKTWNRVSVLPSGKEKRLVGAGYYFGLSRSAAIVEGHSHIGGYDADWEMEDGLYRRKSFKIAMLCALFVLFCCLTFLGAGLVWVIHYNTRQ